ncbi:DUF6585 family protein [Ktedonospora formicarum]|uniref:Uncharacterized protein n=1 Tax=Ktedonospora formicarum TaxID=2778364 RepID=A0A8J3I809_9CHLR|nr:DUF6585 family protein [Ktedonospora formicarum]GHO47059.1 hypothetical protein KSX_52220 [Ktedonospora formicarum]
MKPVSFDSQSYEDQNTIENYQLGELRREFTPNVRVHMMFVALFLIVASFQFYRSFLKGDQSFSTPGLLPYAMILLSCLIGLIALYRCRKMRISVHEYGLLAVRANGVEAIRWDEIAIVWHKCTRNSKGVTHNYTPQRRDGRQFKLGYFFSTNQLLGGMIEQETTRLLFPEALENYQQGQLLSYGPFTLDQLGLNYKGRSLPWSEVADIQVVRGHVLVKEHDTLFAWANVVYGEVPNLRVLQRLCTRILNRPDEEVWT